MLEWASLLFKSVEAVPSSPRLQVPIPAQYRVATFQYILHEGTEDPTRELLLTVGLWGVALHDEILVFNQGFWQKDHALWAELQKVVHLTRIALTIA